MLLNVIARSPGVLSGATTCPGSIKPGGNLQSRYAYQANREFAHLPTTAHCSDTCACTSQSTQSQEVVEDGRTGVAFVQADASPDHSSLLLETLRINLEHMCYYIPEVEAMEVRMVNLDSHRAKARPANREELDRMTSVVLWMYRRGQPVVLWGRTGSISLLPDQLPTLGVIILMNTTPNRHGP